VRAVLAVLLRSDAAAVGMKAFNEKRRAEFTGR
jgi:hypothetical protein